MKKLILNEERAVIYGVIAACLFVMASAVVAALNISAVIDEWVVIKNNAALEKQYQDAQALKWYPKLASKTWTNVVVRENRMIDPQFVGIWFHLSSTNTVCASNILIK